MKKVLIMGMGSIGCRHLKNLKKILPSVTIAVLRHSENKLDDEYIRIIAHEFYDISEAKKFKPDILIVANPTSLHVKTALEFIEDVSGIFIEKPLSDSLFEANKLVLKSNRKIIHIACPLRFHPVIKFLKEYSKSLDKILNISIFSGSFLPKWRPGTDYRVCYSAQKDLGGGVSLDLVHEIDYMRWIFGDFTEGFFGSSKVSDLDIDVEDVAYSILKLNIGAICELHLDYFRKTPKRQLEVTAANEIVTADVLNSTISICKNESVTSSSFDFDSNDMYIAELKYFIDCVEKNTPSFNNPSFALETLKIAIYMRENKGIVKQ